MNKYSDYKGTVNVTVNNMNWDDCEIGFTLPLWQMEELGFNKDQTINLNILSIDKGIAVITLRSTKQRTVAEML